MTRTEALNYLNETKVFVKDKCEEIQEKLFSLGIHWSNDQWKVRKNRPFLFIKDGRITWGKKPNYFYSHPNREITPEVILNITLDNLNYRPFKTPKECWEEMQKHQPFGWIKSKYEDEWFQVLCVDNLSDFKHRLSNNIFADGTPFGIKED